jgi:WXG100 family type VII secretion target
MTAPRVRADYDQLAQVAHQFASQAEGAGRMLQGVRQAMQTLEGGEWIGRGATSFYQEMNSQVLPTLNRLYRALQEAQRVTQQIRTIVKGAEDEAASYLRGEGGAGAGAAGAAPGSITGAGASLSGVAGVGASGATNAGGGGGLLDRVFGAVRDSVGTALMGPSAFILDGIGRLTGAGDIGSEMGRGMFDEAVDMGRGLWQLASNRDATVEALARGLANPSLLWEGFTRPYVEAWESGHPWQAVGRGVFAVGTLFVGAGEAGAAGRAGEVAVATGRTTEVLAATGRTGEVLGAGGRTVEALGGAGRVNAIADAGRVAAATNDASRLAEGAGAVRAMDEAGNLGGAARATGQTADVTRGTGLISDAPGAASRSWDELTAMAEQPTARQTAGGFRSTLARDGSREVRIIEGRIGPGIDQSESMAGYSLTLDGEHATHSVGMQLGENLPEGLTSAPAGFNLSEMKIVENSIRETADAAAAMGAQVETRTVVRIEHVTLGAEEVPVLVGVEREAWIVVPGTDTTIPFAEFSAELDPVTRTVVPGRTWVLRPGK